MTPEKEEELRQAIIKAVPEIVKKEFGCKAVEKSTGMMFFWNSHCWQCVNNYNVKKSMNEFRGIIIGRDIRFADVLILLGEYKPVGVNKHYTDSNTLWHLYGWWKLENDNLDNQSEETKQFLYDVICGGKE